MEKNQRLSEKYRCWDAEAIFVSRQEPFRSHMRTYYGGKVTPREAKSVQQAGIETFQTAAQAFAIAEWLPCPKSWEETVNPYPMPTASDNLVDDVVTDREIDAPRREGD